MSERRVLPRAAVVVMCAMAMMAFGCASSGPHEEGLTQIVKENPRAFAGNQGGAWEVLFAPAGPLPEVASAEVRRDEELNVREPEDILMLGMWPEAPRAHLGWTGRLFLPRRASHVLYLRHHPRPLHPDRHWIWH